MKEPRLAVRTTPKLRATVAKSDAIGAACDVLIVPIRPGDEDVPKSFRAFDRAAGGAIARAMHSGDVRGKLGEIHLVHPDAPRGPFEVSLIATFDPAAGVRDAVVPVRGTVGLALPVTPTAVNFGLVREQEVYRRTLLVGEVPDPGTLRVDCELNYLTAEVEDDGGGARISLRYAPLRGMGAVKGQVVITDSATGRTRRIPVALRFEQASVGA